jgi:iron(III) transport system ATP-binding protein
VLPESRGVGLVFQDGVLFPHLSVADNIAFGLRQMSREMQATRVAELLTLVGLGGFEQRNPQHLSGGQQQRIALARALAPRPPVLLLDEPFANLDAALRNELRQELREIVLATGTTALFVTHDQEEALSIADRAAVIDRGQIVQLGTPQAIYERPASSYVARFVGTANLVAAFGHGAHAVCILGEIALRDRYEGALELMIRPEQLLLTSDELGNAIVERITYYGYDLLITLRVSDGSSLQARIRPGSTLRPGSRVRVTTTEAVVAFPQLGMELR